MTNFFLQNIIKTDCFQLREKVRKQQNERDTEQNDHSLMLRELQKLLASERIIREQLEQQVGPQSHDVLPSNMVCDVINMAAEQTEHVDIPLHC